MNLDSFRLDSLVLHDVPQPGEEHEELILTDAPVALDEQLTGYFERKITQSLRNRGLEVVADPTGSAVVRDGIGMIHADHDQLVAVSQALARHLDQSQTRRNPPGLLGVGIGEVDDGEVITVLKLEREQGLRLLIRAVGEHIEVDLEFLRDLTLTDKTKIFKTSLLRLEDRSDPLSLDGVVSDDQRGREEGTGVANFFLSTFLGCELKTNPEKATLDFVLAAEEFINQDVSSDERRATYQVALLAKMQDKTLQLRPRDWANQNLESNDRPRFLERVAAHGLDPDRALDKDTSLAKVKGFRMVFEHGMALIGSEDDLRNRVRMPRAAGAAEGVVIQDTLKRLTGR